jgi:hypothetical protein
MISERLKRRFAREILIAVGIALGGAVASIINSLMVPFSDNEIAWFIGFIIFCYIVRLIAWAINVLIRDKEQKLSR